MKSVKKFKTFSLFLTVTEAFANSKEKLLIQTLILSVFMLLCCMIFIFFSSGSVLLKKQQQLHHQQATVSTVAQAVSNQAPSNNQIHHLNTVNCGLSPSTVSTPAAPNGTKLNSFKDEHLVVTMNKTDLGSGVAIPVVTMSSSGANGNDKRTISELDPLGK